MCSILAVLAFMLYSCWIDFQPADWLAQDTWFVAAVGGVACTVWIEWAVWTKRITPRQMSRTFFVLMAPFFALLIAAVIWVFIAHGLAGTVTRLYGTEVVQSPVIMHTEDRYHRRECRPQLLGASVHGFAQDHLCISVSYYTAHPDHRVEVRLEGRQGQARGSRTTSASPQG